MIQPGDRVFLMRLGVEPKGIIASGWVTKKSYPDEHWEYEKAESGKRSLFVDCEWERLLDPNIDPPLTILNLQSGGLKNVRWTPQASGMEIPTGECEGLEKLWAAHLGVSSLGAVYPDEEIAGFEGALRVALVRHRRREQKLRDAKIAQTLKERAGRLRCEVPGCGFDFLEVYGEIGRNYVQVHHLKQLSELESPTKTTLKDLVMVCANCHVMIHRGGECRSMKELIPAT
jgi:5-methylcytosine-specific restriction protein A